VHADVFPTLEALHREGIRTAVLSNWDDRLRPLLRRLGLEPFFSTITISCEVGVAKPDPGIFRAAASALNLEPQFILHVGDDPILDLAGARDVGLHALLIRRDRPISTPDSIQTLLQIRDAIRAS
jgi:putative hydrolase of the HAD superfamily